MVFAGKEYGTGSSRDWAAKGTQLLGVKAVVAESFERIHRSNLVGMGVLPLQFMDGENARVLGLDGSETIDITGLDDGAVADGDGHRHASPTAAQIRFEVRVLLLTPKEVEYFRNGGILHYVLRQLAVEEGGVSPGAAYVKRRRLRSPFVFGALAAPRRPMLQSNAAIRHRMGPLVAT